MRGFSSEYFKKSSKEDEKGKYTIYFYDMKVEKQMEKAVPIKSVCYENDLYELIGEDGNVFLPNYLECCLAALEKMFGNYRRKLESKAFCKKNYKSNCFLAQEEKVFWQTYIIIQLLRLPKIIKEAEQFSGEILKKDISKKGVHNLIRVLFLPFFDENVAGDPTVAVIEGILERMKGMSFAVGIDDLGRGVTSDNPVAIYANKKGEFESVIFPVTAKICLFMFKNEEKKNSRKNYCFSMEDNFRKEIIKSISIGAVRKIYSNHILNKAERECIEEARHEKEKMVNNYYDVL